MAPATGKGLSCAACWLLGFCECYRVDICAVRGGHIRGRGKDLDNHRSLSILGSSRRRVPVACDGAGRV